MPLANITLLQPFNIDSFASFDFGNISVGNLKTDNLLYANGVARSFATTAQGNLADTSVQPGDLANVATTGSYTDLTNKPTLFSGSYVDLTNKPTLGTAAATDATAYATSAQGTKADTALQTADLVGYATESYVGNSIANLVASAPAALDTLNELAIALGNDASYSTTITNALANKLSTSNFASTANTWISTQSTSELAEGSNLYFTDIRANSAIDARVTKSFVDNLAVVANIANVAYSVTGSNVTGPVAYAAIANSVSGSNVVGDVSGANHANVADVANSIAGTNVTGQVANALIAGTVYTNAQPNITSVGTLTDLTVLGNITGNYIIGNGSQLTGLPAGYTDTNANAAIDARVTKTFVDNLSVVANIANIAYSITGSNVTGQVANSLVAGTVYTNAQPNITSVGSLTSLTVSGNTDLGGISNVKITGGTADYVLSTDGTGNLSWVEQASGTGGTSGGESTVTSVDTFTGDGTETVFTLSVAPQSINQTFINYNGALQLRSAYTLSGTDITFSEPPANGSVIEVTTQMGVTSGSGNLTVRTYTADGVQTAYEVSAGVNATNILVTENGLVQTPAIDYTVTGSTLTFTSAPGFSVKIQIRELGVAVATITPAGSNTHVLFNDSGSFGSSSQFTFNKPSNTLTVGNLVVSNKVDGDLVPSANVTYSLGSDTNRWKDLFLSGNTIDLGGAKIKTDATSGAIAFVPPPSVSIPNPTALVISSSGGISTAATTNGVLATNAISDAAATGVPTSPRYITMYTTGNLSPSTGTSRYYPPSDINISNVSASLSTPSDVDLTFSIYKNGANVGTFTIAANAYLLTKTSANISVSTTDYLTVNIVTGNGSELKMDLQYTAT